MRLRGMTIIELLVVIAIIMLLAALLLPVFVQVRKRSYEPICISNLRQLHIAFSLYVDDYAGVYPRRAKYLQPYVKDRRILRCPADPIPEGAATSHDPFIPRDQWFEVSYYYVGDQFLPFIGVREGGREVDYLDRLRQQDPNHGTMVCLLHGEPMGERIIAPELQMRGKVLRLRLDGSVQTTYPGFVCYERVDEGIAWGRRHPWSLFTDVRPIPDPLLKKPFLDEEIYRVVPCPPEYR